MILGWDGIHMKDDSGARKRSIRRVCGKPISLGLSEAFDDW